MRDTKAKYTAGPWAANWSTRTNNGPKQGWFVEAKSQEDQDAYGPIADLPDERDNAEANARLIAQAPAMAELLQRLNTSIYSLAYYTNIRQEAERILSAINGEVQS